MKYLTALENFEPRDRRTISAKLSELLKKWSDFDEDYATWLSENLHRLNDQSVKLLAELGAKSFDHVRFSTVTDLSDAK